MEARRKCGDISQVLEENYQPRIPRLAKVGCSRCQHPLHFKYPKQKLDEGSNTAVSSHVLTYQGRKLFFPTMISALPKTYSSAMALYHMARVETEDGGKVRVSGIFSLS